MNIPPAGRERDKLIAQLKGWIEVGSHYRIPPNGATYYTELTLPRFSNSTDFWELWEELPNAEYITIHAYVNGMWYLECGMNWGIKVTGNSFPDVVSKAWLEWKTRKDNA